MRTTAEQLHRDLERVLGTDEPLVVRGTPLPPVDLKVVIKDATWLLRHYRDIDLRPAPNFGLPRPMPLKQLAAIIGPDVGDP